MKAKKSLGQNFLKSKRVLEKIVEAGKVNKKDTVLEVGPGKGTLTEKLLEKAGKVVAVEKDGRLIEFLKEKFKKEISEKRLEIIHDDIFEFNPKTYFLKPKTYKIIANIPYYITGQFLRKFLSGENKPTLMVILLQKEVAERILARNSRESLLSIGVKSYGKPKYIQKVSKRYFSPEPKVDSAVLLIEGISGEFFKDLDEEKFWQILKVGFSQKRKFLSGNLTKISNKEKIERVINECVIPEKTRAENLSLKDWKCLTKNLKD